MKSEELLVDAALAAAVVRRRSEAGSSGSREGLREALRWLHQEGGALSAQGGQLPPERAALAIATVATVDMSLAFSLWSHRMVLTYLDEADHLAFRRDPWRRALLALEVVGSTALAAPMASHVMGSPLPIVARQVGDELELSGKIAWASNLHGAEFLIVTAAEIASGDRRIVALKGGQRGLRVDPFPELVDLQETASSSVTLDRVRVAAEDVLGERFEAFLRSVRPRFLLWQGSFCWGLAARALREARALVGKGFTEAFGPELEALSADAERIGTGIVGELESDARARRAERLERAPTILDALKLRLDAALLAGAACRLEAKTVGGRGYVARSETARRQREAAFLPIQSPTEGQLRWELSRSS
jgi:alkylation response protein AidB-like acyl-CoA dehydrogenase